MNELLVRNLVCLTDYNYELALEMPTIDSEAVEALRVQDDIVFKLTDNEGNEFYSASIYDPEYEARQFLYDVNYDNTGYIVFGLNSSAVLKEILSKKTETAWVLVVEKDRALIKKLLEEIDLTPYLENRLQRLVFIYGDQDRMEGFFDQFLHSIVGYYFLQAEVVRTYPTYRLQQDEYQWCFETVVDKIRKNMINLGNSLEDSQKGIYNELQNIKHVLRNKRFKQLENKFEGVPIICVASGPSLDKQLPLLKEVQGRALIISAESAFRVLLKNGITPDALCILERGEASYDLSLKGIDIPMETVLFGLTLIDPRIGDQWPGHQIPVFKTNVSHSRLLSDAFGDFGTMYSGNSVAHMNFNLASYLGGNPIIFIGQDLAYAEDGKTHSKHSFYDKDEVEKLDDRYKRIIKQSLEDTGELFNKEVYVDGYYGGKVRSRELWRQFLTWFIHLLKEARKENSLYINATEGGADIPGMVKMPFKEAIGQYCHQRVTSIAETVDQVPMESIEISDKLQLFVEYMHDLTSRMKRFSKDSELNLQYIEDFQPGDGSNGGMQSLKLARILKLTDSILQGLIADPFGSFYFSPLIANYHVKVNRISRITTTERIELILKHQNYLLVKIVEGESVLQKILSVGLTDVIEEFGYTEDDFTLPDQEVHDYLEDA